MKDFETVTPAMAAKWLENNAVNRTLSSARVDNLAKTMESGGWELNGKTIVISDTGRLMDGQHRLSAVVKSNTPQKMTVIRGVSESVFHTIDTGSVRTAADVLSISGVSNAEASVLATMIRIDLLVSNVGTTHGGGGHKHLVTPSLILEAFQNNPEYLRCARHVLNYPKNLRPIPVGPLAFICYRTFQIDETFSDQWIHKFITGEGLTDVDNVKTLRAKLWRDSAATKKTASAIKLLWCIKTWASDMKGKKVGRLFKVSNNILKAIALDSDASK